ncbi:hypothetical protein ACWDY4_31410 [Streptomyces olivaceoviridis]
MVKPSFSPTTGQDPQIVLGAPARSRRRTPSAKAAASSKSVPCAQKMTSALRAAKSRPSPQSPAWKITG